jgi:pimeloyl-ACP methyl ester carboxylesterase
MYPGTDQHLLIMATFILVHGGNMSTDTWNRLSTRNRYPPGGRLGARYWDDTAAYLRKHGHTVFAPALGDESSHSLSDHIGQVCDIMEKNDPEKIILVRHSYGGLVITGAAARRPKRIRHLVFLDSALPEPGESLMDILQRVYTGRHAAILPEPTPAYSEKIRYVRLYSGS